MSQKRIDIYKVAIEAIRMALLECAQDESVDPRYTLIVIGRIMHNLDNVLAIEDDVEDLDVILSRLRRPVN